MATMTTPLMIVSERSMTQRVASSCILRLVGLQPELEAALAHGSEPLAGFS